MTDGIRGGRTTMPKNTIVNILITSLALIFIGGTIQFLMKSYQHELTLRHKKSRLKETEDDLSKLMREEDNQASD